MQKKYMSDPDHIFKHLHANWLQMYMAYKGLQNWYNYKVKKSLSQFIGAYQVCFDNTASRFAEKLVYIYLVTYVPEEWSKYLQEIQSVSASVQNFTVTPHF